MDFKFGVVFWDLFSGLLEVMVLKDPVSRDMVPGWIFIIHFFKTFSYAAIFSFR